MKKYLLLVLLPLCTILLVSCLSNTKRFDIPEATSITLISGTTGETVEIADVDIIKQITDEINSLSFNRGNSSKNSSGWSYSVRWHDADAKELERIVIMGNGAIDYGNYFWSPSKGSIGSEILNELLKGIR